MSSRIAANLRIHWPKDKDGRKTTACGRAFLSWMIVPINKRAVTCELCLRRLRSALALVD